MKEHGVPHAPGLNPVQQSVILTAGSLWIYSAGVMWPKMSVAGANTCLGTLGGQEGGMGSYAESSR